MIKLPSLGFGKIHISVFTTTIYFLSNLRGSTFWKAYILSVLLALGKCVLILNLYFPLYNLEWKFFVGTNGA